MRIKSKFKVGDLVVCCQERDGLTRGKTYRVESLQNPMKTTDYRNGIQVQNDNGDRDWYFIERFELHESTKVNDILSKYD